MQLSKETLTILRNFASINSSLIILPGQQLATIAENKSIFAETTVNETFPIDFRIYDLSEFLSIMGLFSAPELEFNNKFVSITEGNSTIKFFGASPEIVKDHTRTIKFPEPEITFILDQNQLSMIRKAAGALKASDISIIGDNQQLKIVIGDKKNSTSNVYEVSLGETEMTFQANFKLDALKILSETYTVAISTKKISRFTCASMPLTYYIAIESDSVF